MAHLENFRLVVFRSVAQHLSFRKAAEALYLTQPAVSLQIKALEEELGVQLFDRTGTRIALTASGDVLLRYATQMQHLAAAAESEIASVAGEHAGQLALGASTTIAQYVLAGLLSEFRRLHPRVTLALISGNTEFVVRALQEQRISLGLIEGPARSRDVKTEPFLLDQLVLIVPAAHEWADRASIPPAELGTVPLLLREHGSGTRDVVEAALAPFGLRRSALHIAMELDTTESIKSAVESGLGVGFVSRWALGNDTRRDAAFKVVEIEGLRIERQFLVATPSGPEQHGPAAEFRRFLLSRTPPAATPARVQQSHNKRK